jgi:hypothetical protein
MNILRIYFEEYQLLMTMQTKNRRVMPETFKVYPIFRDEHGKNPRVGAEIEMSLAEAKVILPSQYFHEC